MIDPRGVGDRAKRAGNEQEKEMDRLNATLTKVGVHFADKKGVLATIMDMLQSAACRDIEMAFSVYCRRNIFNKRGYFRPWFRSVNFQVLHCVRLQVLSQGNRSEWG